MEKNKKWHFALIFSVIALTLYNALPTLFYYATPLRAPIEDAQASKIAKEIIARVDGLEQEAKDWLKSYCKLIHTRPLSIETKKEAPETITLSFTSIEEANRFRSFFPKAGSLIPFAPARLSLLSEQGDSKQVSVQRQIPVALKNAEHSFTYAKQGSLAYRKIAIDRSAGIALALGGVSPTAIAMKNFEEGKRFFLEELVAHILAIGDLLEQNKLAGLRAVHAVFQGPFASKATSLQRFMQSLDTLRDELKTLKEQTTDDALLHKIALQESNALRAKSLLRKWEEELVQGAKPATLASIESDLIQHARFHLGERNPFFAEISLDESNGRITLIPHKDLLSSATERQQIANEIARIAHITQEEIKAVEGGKYEVALAKSATASGFLTLDLEKVAALEIEQLKKTIGQYWNPRHPDLQNVQLIDSDQYDALPADQKEICLVVCNTRSDAMLGLNPRSLYIAVKGIDRLLRNYERFQESELASLASEDVQKLTSLLRQSGFFAYPISASPALLPIKADFIFEKSQFFAPILAATREDFTVLGTQKYALLEFSDREQRRLVENRIDTKIHEDLLRCSDEYRAAQVSLNPSSRFEVPPPTRSVLLSNLLLSVKKYFRGDDRKIIRWGLDLSGGKTVQIELLSGDGIPVTSDEDVQQGINELYTRVNKMGVAEVSIRKLGHHIVIDFPGSQALSASELIRGSTMHFHVVNEKFSLSHPPLAETANRFLMEIWNEAIATGKKDPQSINLIAWNHLYGGNSLAPQPQTDAARTLLAQGLSLQHPEERRVSHAIDESTCKIAKIRGDERSDWMGQSHPLLIVFRNFALEGSQLENIHPGYDPNKGNYLSFEVKGPFVNKEGQKINPRANLRSWTHRFSREKIGGTPYEACSQGRGWRMAVLLNDQVISAPTLDSPLEASAMISGNFSQREVQQLSADLRAGSLTFTPHILSEKNVSPELGTSDRNKGIIATFIALLLVIGSMTAYYRFAGWVASVAVLFNLLILWATLQNLGATLTLAGIAGIILTIGMAVDANVLVFERIKEEFAATGRISSAIQAGYKKAFSAILDSNVTTIIAALILVNFDAGPIKSFAINLIIGIASSMFTALFMTRFYFNQWLQNPKNRFLSMANWVQATRFDFLKKAKPAFLLAIAVIIAGSCLVYAKRATIFGMDFTGGYALNLELSPDQEGKYAERVMHALTQKGLSSQDVQVQKLNPANQLRVLFSTSLEEQGKPFYGMPIMGDVKPTNPSYEANPRLGWTIGALQGAGIALAPESIAHLGASWTAMSGQMSASMRNHALIGLFISFVCIFIYLALRFEYKFAAAALVCLAHDVLITIGVLGLLHALGVHIQIDLNTVAAMMTIVGYSLNDTIIIFDRIREEMRLSQSKNLPSIVNSALNATLSRTTITSGTTLLVLLALVALGGPSIFGFALVMTIGVFFGTLSSWFIASPLMLIFHRREEIKEKRST